MTYKMKVAATAKGKGLEPVVDQINDFFRRPDVAEKLDAQIKEGYHSMLTAQRPGIRPQDDDESPANDMWSETGEIATVKRDQTQ